MKSKFYTVLGLFMPFLAVSQTMTDGVFMSKKTFCGGIVQQQDRFSEYWEGTTLRINRNMGTMKGNMTGAMGSYGITTRLNLLASVPYIATKATAGTSSGFSGLQDLTLALKYNLYDTKNFTFIASVGGSLPLTDYVAHHPFAIGTQSKTVFGRTIVRFLNEKGWTATANAAYTLRSNIEIDAHNYYTDRNINSNEVFVPNLLQFGARGGYYTYRFAAEALLEHSAAQGGFDIRRNDVMFPAANRQIGTRVGIFTSYRIKPLGDLQVVASVMQTVAGRNVGKALSVGGGLMYIIESKKKKND